MYLLQCQLERDWIYSLARDRKQISQQDRTVAPLFLRHYNLTSSVSVQRFNIGKNIKSLTPLKGKKKDITFRYYSPVAKSSHDPTV